MSKSGKPSGEAPDKGFPGCALTRRFDEAARSERDGPQARLYLARIHLKRNQAPQA